MNEQKCKETKEAMYKVYTVLNEVCNRYVNRIITPGLKDEILAAVSQSMLNIMPDITTELKIQYNPETRSFDISHPLLDEFMSVEEVINE